MKLSEAFEEIEDKRVQGRTLYPLSDILTMCLVGYLFGLKYIEDIVFFCETNVGRLKKFIPFKNGVPKKDTVHRVLAMIDCRKFEEAMVKFTKSCFKDIKGGVAIDGKTICGSSDGEKKAAHIVSAWADELGVCLAQYKTEEKSNEITAIPELLELMDLRGVIVTIDAMGCQKEIVKKITEKKSDYLISLKGNQPALHDEVKRLFEDTDDEKFNSRHKIQAGEAVTEKNHGRIEKRQCFLCTDLSWLDCRYEWAKLKAVGMVKGQVTKSGQTTEERRYFITSLTDVDKAAKSLRSHWGIENRLHWCLDMLYDEDRTRSRKDNSPQNLAIIRKLALNTLRTTPAPLKFANKKMSASKRQILCLSSDSFLESVLGLF